MSLALALLSNLIQKGYDISFWLYDINCKFATAAL